MHKEYNICDFIGNTSEQSDWTNAFKAAVAKIREENGGTLIVPKGNYLTRSIKLTSDMELYLESGAVINFTDDIENYEIIDIEFEGVPMKMHMPCIYARGEKNVAVTGYGTINGNGARWWKERRQLDAARPYLICFYECSRVRLSKVHLTNSPAWTVHPAYCQDVSIQGISIKNPADSPNTDGINPYSCQNVRIADCLIDVGDDCIAIKSGTEETPNKVPCENITITGCNMLHGHGGVVIGSEMSGSIRNVTVSNCTFQDTDRGIRLKTRRHRGGAMERMTFSNIMMDRVLCPFIFNMYYFCGKNGNEQYVWDKEPYPVDDGTPVIRDILISNVFVNDAEAMAGFIYGLPESNIENITFSNCHVRMNPNKKPALAAMMGYMEPTKAAGFFIRNAKNITMRDVKIEHTIGDVFDMDVTAHVIIL